ncbi:ribosome biogenesis GTPase YlqF [Marinobacter psychrophilus]|jgi:ribosome biogenesis GTPase A|uniref:ribosome biogenesis GTPase YlqF n=1 Tax=Marinobacter psychrophilus TaxID=330734 RepID=UPI001B72ECEF|nr:ribosome biogenesis GTPase YlqF [Marinobacter psychrophilus]MBQ0762957.1 ribosome biogenesis GTPase YlqF [Marinobacter psychrophilus]MBQ0846105.1 ribosome biogenesis GTPase YlqF [Marinobacter psychrophilus]
MAINWFPGHMHKARKEIKEVMPQMDLIIEVVDARIPFSSENPLVPALRGDTPLIKVLNKRDLADPDVTGQWQSWLERERGVKTITLTHNQRSEALDILNLAEQLTPNHDRQKSALRVMILGIPNVGKSTLINTLAGRPAAKTGNEPAVTRAQQAIKLPNNILLYDTPGFLWPKLSPAACGYRLAVTGAIRSAVLDFEDVALFTAEYLLAHYPEFLTSRYGLDPLPVDGLAAMDAIAAKRRFFGRGGIPDLHKVSEVLLNEFRAGKLGRISLETPRLIQHETEIALAEAEVQASLDAEKAIADGKKKAKTRRNRKH